MIEYHNRLLAVGPTRSGKSEILNVLASGLQGQWVLVDPKDEFAIDGVEKTRDVGALDFANARVLHWVPPSDPKTWERFFGRVLGLRQADPPGRITVVVHEAGYACQFKPGLVGPNQNELLAQGEAHGIGAWYASTRPACLPTFATSEPAHVFAMAEAMTRADDEQRLADAMGIERRALRDAQDHVRASFPPREQGESSHAYIWGQRRVGVVKGMGPLPDELRAGNVVRRTTPE